ncbi:glutamine--fructose-6-phosphate transaminase (isomerizing) [bacterium]|nr:glutamine--fructose-6-phosphate transaminase (isomerizing) [bacterium]
MCGIVGGVTRKKNVVSFLRNGLKILEYRGYDSAGIAIVEKGKIERMRRLGKVSVLDEAINDHPLNGTLGIAHTRWATTGMPSEYNAHPHISDDENGGVALVHNGIIENYEKLREWLGGKGYKFTSETDTEVIAHLVHYYMREKENTTLTDAVARAVKGLEGDYALCVIRSDDDKTMVAARNGSPLVIGKGDDGYYVASDELALKEVVRESVCRLENGDIATLTATTHHIADSNGKTVERPFVKLSCGNFDISKGDNPHHTLKEIKQQKQAVSDTLLGRISGRHVIPESFGPGTLEILRETKALHIVACGTSYHAGLVAKQWNESKQFGNIPVSVEVASEFISRDVAVFPNTVFVFISQSGETKDTLAAIEKVKKENLGQTLVICNVGHSSLMQESGLKFLTRAGPEIGVASTKAFTTQLTALALLTLILARRNPAWSQEKEARYVQNLRELPAHIEKTLTIAPDMEKLAGDFVKKPHAIFLGRGALEAVAREGALKLTEITYIHAQAYPAGELKHGPLALIDDEMPVIVIAPKNGIIERLKSNIDEVRARGGKLHVFADSGLKHTFDEKKDKVIFVPGTEDADEFASPIIHTIPLQMLAYYVGVIKGLDVDQPRNLAKSVSTK